MGSKRLDYLADYQRHGFDVEVMCRNCGRQVVFKTVDLIAWAKQRRQIPSIDALKTRLVCRGRDGDPGCGEKRLFRVRPTAPMKLPEPPPAPPAPVKYEVPLGVNPAEWAKARDDRQRRWLIRRARG